MTDTGSMQPIPEAIAWSQRADAWAQHSEGEGRSGRWSEVAATGRPTFPADGVGWRTETAERLSTEQTARWRQTTEWRSASGTHGWRSTTEAWQTGSGAEDFRPPVDPPVREQVAISGTAWPTPDEEPAPEAGQWHRFTDPVPQQQQAADARPAWQQFAGPAWQQQAPQPPPLPSAGPPAWQQLVDPASSPYGAGTPAYRQSPEADDGAGAQRAPDSSSDAAGQGGQPSSTWFGPAGTWQRSGDDPAASRDSGTAALRDSGTAALRDSGTASRDSASPWHQPADEVPSRFRPASAVPAWEQPATPTWQQPASAVPSWQQPASAPPSWQRSDATGSSWQQPDAATPSRQQPASAAPSWQQPDTATPSWQRPASGREPASAVPVWQQPADGTPSRRQPVDPAATRQSLAPDATPTWRSGAATYGSGAPADDGRHLVREDDRERWRRDAREDRTRQIGRRRAPETGARTSGGTGWTTRSDADNWAGHTDTGSIPLFPDRVGSDSQTWRRDGETSAWRREDPPDSDDRPTRRRAIEGARPVAEPHWRDSPIERDQRGGSAGRDGRGGSTESDWRGGSAEQAVEPDSGSWSRGEAGEGRRRDPYGWRDDEHGVSDTGSGRRGIEAAPAADPWAGGATDTGVMPTAWQQPVTDTGSWRSEPRERPYNPNRVGRRRAADPDAGAPPAAPVDPALWHQEPGVQPGAANWPIEDPPPDDAVTEIRPPGSWRLEERESAARGSASYRATDTGDWRRDLAAETGGNLAEGESRRFGTQDFVPFRPSGAAAAPVSAKPAPVPTSPPVPDGREQLLVGTATGSHRQDPPDTHRAPRQATGSYERRPVGSAATAPGRQNTGLLEPDEDEIEESTGGPLAAVGYTVIWYGVPVVLFVLYMLVLNGSQQAHALSTLADAAPQFGLSLVLSMLVAVGLRWASGSWKAASVGLAAAVMGGGLATVLSSAITGNSLS